MINTVGIVQEIKTDEDRVAISPSGVHFLVSDGHRVVIQAGAGLGSGIPHGEYANAGAAQGLNIGGGKVFHKGVADTFGRPLAPLSALGSP